MEAVKPITRFEDAPEYQEFLARRQEMNRVTNNRDPYFIRHDSALTDTSLVDGVRKLNFASYNYVGMSGRKEVSEAAKAAIDQYGTSASGSRLLAGEKTIYRQLEREIADWKRSDDALVLVSGHATNVTFVGNFCGEGDLIVYDSLSHNSVWQGCQLSRATCRPFPHNDIAALDRILSTRREKFGKVLIIAEGAYSMDGDVGDIPGLVRIKQKYGCFLMVDEAHSSCVLGPTGGGVDEYFDLQPGDVDIHMGTLSKGLGACGGYLAGSQAIIDYLRYMLPGFAFSVGISPPLAAAVRKAIELLHNEPEIMDRLHHNIHFFCAEARKRNLNICLAGESAIIPVLIGDDLDAYVLSNAMRDRNVCVPPAVFPAVPRGEARLRFNVISEHTDEEILAALDTLVECAKENGIALPAGT